ncbi:hypothetical protein MKW94_007300 [Papaver nudicaule]|uniref:Guanine nucleotide-binding protein subunit beta-like protein n=1 Tax=Papaver nudicaule TaxID=74823 RepID=A0AA41VMJ4_PAPNU|nr:hypothetical protein [Papaver nudicaule]
MIVSSSRDKSILVWTLKKQQGNYGVPKRRLTGHSHYVQDVVLSSDGQSALSASWDCELRLWNLNTGDTTCTFVGHTKTVSSVSFSRDNLQIVSSSRDRSIKLWNTLGECQCTIWDGNSRTNWVNYVRFIPNRLQPTVVSASRDKTVKVWNLAKRHKLRSTFAGHGGYLNTVTVSPDSSMCASGGKDGVVFLWGLDGGYKKLCSFDAAGGIIHAMCFSPTRYWLCAATEKAGVHIWDIEYKCITFYCSSLNWSSDGSTLFAGYTDGVIRVWEVHH